MIRTLNVSKEICVYGAVRPTNIRVTPNGREHESRTHSSSYGVGALAARWPTVCLALGKNYWREVQESNSTGSAPVHGFQDRSATNHRHLPHVKDLRAWWPRRDLHSQSRRRGFLRPVRMHSATGPWSTEWESNPSNQLCRLTPNRLVFSA